MTIARKKIEYGDFQTPQNLADSVTVFLRSTGISPVVIVEPTCGLGSFLHAARTAFPSASTLFAFDINDTHIQELHKSLEYADGTTIHIKTQDFFEMDWKGFFQGLKGEVLVIGNPPWVTNSSLGLLRSTNLPEKSNFQSHSGFAAKTGKANFDISEWMLIKLLDALAKQRACIAMLCKTTTARKVLKHAWLNRFPIGRASIHLIDAHIHFDVSVDACLLIIHTGLVEMTTTAAVYADLSFSPKISTIGLYGKELVANMDEYRDLRDLEGLSYYTWRSGVKHDASRIMEFTRGQHHYRNGFGEEVNIEETYLYPLLKSSDLANGKLTPSKFVLLTQRHPSDDTAEIKVNAPDTWSYLIAHADILDGRQSIIYQKRPRFSVFGIGDYTFAPWKVAVSGLYKSLRFQVIGSFQGGKPLVVDDTCYFVPCGSKQEALFVASLLNSDLCQKFLRSLVFFDAKRPITSEILNRIDLKRVANRLGVDSEARKILVNAQKYEKKQALLVFEKEETYRKDATADS